MSGENGNTDRFKQIQEIIFGEYQDHWETKLNALESLIRKQEKAAAGRFEFLESQLKGFKAETESGFDDLSKDHQEKQDQMQSMFNEKVMELENKISLLSANKIDHVHLGSFLIEWGKQVKDGYPE